MRRNRVFQLEVQPLAPAPPALLFSAPSRFFFSQYLTLVMVSSPHRMVTPGRRLSRSTQLPLMFETFALGQQRQQQQEQKQQVRHWRHPSCRRCPHPTVFTPRCVAALLFNLLTRPRQDIAGGDAGHIFVLLFSSRYTRVFPASRNAHASAGGRTSSSPGVRVAGSDNVVRPASKIGDNSTGDIIGPSTRTSTASSAKQREVVGLVCLIQ